MKKTQKSKKTTSSVGAKAQTRAQLLETIRLSKLLQEKCELREATDSWKRGLALAEKLGDVNASIECLQGLLRLAGEALDTRAIARWELELERLLSKRRGRDTPATVWASRGNVALRCGDYRVAQRHFHTYLKTLRGQTPGKSEFNYDVARGWYWIAYSLFERGNYKRAQFLATTLVRQAKEHDCPRILGYCFQLLGKISERKREFEVAMRFHQESHAAFLVQHDWYSHLTVLLAYARIARLQRNYVQAYWYLDLIDKAAPGVEFGAVRKEVALERSLLANDAVDLLIDSRQGLVKTRDGGKVALGKQYVLLNILEVLSEAHDEEGSEGRGLSKAELIQKVWNENYRPEAHDNKLYYNINRLRKLIEPDVRKPQYLLNWREGYRLAPGLRVQRVAGTAASGGSSDTRLDAEY